MNRGSLNLTAWKTGVLAVALLSAGMIWLCGEVSAIELVKEGNPVAKIVTASDVPQMVKYAALELQSYIKKISGATLPIETIPLDAKAVIDNKQNYIFVGESPYTRDLGINISGLKTDGFRIVARKNFLALVGHDYAGAPMTGMNRVFSLNETYDKETGISVFGQTGTLYAVYNFLEKYLGVRWFMPGNLGEVIVKQPTIELGDINYEAAPDFTYRRLYFAYGFDSGRFEDMVRWYRRVGFGGDFPVEIIHSFREFIKKHSAKHPEYFYSNGKGNTHVVLTEKAVIEQFVEDIREYFDEHPERKIYPLMPDDMRLDRDMEKDSRLAGIADLSMGREGRFSDYVWEFINKVAEQVYKTHPDKFIGCCAYSDYRLPPTKIEKLQPNVVVMFVQMRNMNANRKNRERVAEIIKKWKEKTNQIYIWEYYNWYYGGRSFPGTPVIFPHLIAEDLHFLKGISKGEFIEAETTVRPVRPFSVNNPGMTHLNYYVTAKYLWNSDQDIEKLLSDYYEKFYGPAVDEMRKFFTLAEEIWNEKIAAATIDANHFKLRHFEMSEQDNERLTEYLKEATEKAGDTVYGKRVSLIFLEFSESQRQGPFRRIGRLLQTLK